VKICLANATYVPTLQFPLRLHLFIFVGTVGIIIAHQQFGGSSSLFSANELVFEVLSQINYFNAMAAWRSGHRIRFRNRSSWFESRQGIWFSG
jgi:hypothetical protein